MLSGGLQGRVIAHGARFYEGVGVAGGVVLILLDRSTWLHLTALGDSAVILPCVALMVAWLLVSRATRGLALGWLLAVCGVGGVVVGSKLLFMVWGIGLPGLDYTGLSGHSAMAALSWPTLLALLAGGARNGVRLLAVAVGMLLAAAIAWSRVALDAHSIPEIVLGWSLGALASAAWLAWSWRAWKLPLRAWPLLLSLLLALPWVYGQRFPSQQLLTRVASSLAANGQLHLRAHLHH
ncbi:phosphatase PAP2 family protein [Rhodanobacter geophilus]|uniref:Phosphatase PAP2 family protein n=1 Tax=Rhodanobacter geophilus TaxID=3162488 RepID=A0ABV3QPJ0_9GAMM